MFEFRVNVEHKISYGSPFILEDEKTLILSFKDELPNKKEKNNIKIHLKVIKLFENYKILREDAKAKDKKQIILLVEDALKSKNPPNYKMRYVIGVPNCKKLIHFERKKPTRTYRKKADTPKPSPIKNEKKPKKQAKCTNEIPKKERATPSPRKRKRSESPPLSKHWSETIIPNNLECTSTSGVALEDQRSSILLQAVNSILGTEASLVTSTTNGNVDSMNLSESHSDIQNLMDAAECLLNASDMDLHTQNNVDLHTVPSLDMHTGPSVELSSEPSLLSPLHSSSFNVTNMTPAIDLNSHLSGISISPAISPKKVKKLKKKHPKEQEKSESEERPKLRQPDFRKEPERPKPKTKIGRDRFMEPTNLPPVKEKQILRKAQVKRRESREKTPPPPLRKLQLKMTPLGDPNQRSARIYIPPEPTKVIVESNNPSRVTRNTQAATPKESTPNLNNAKTKKKQSSRLEYSLEDIVRAQDKVRGKLNQIHNLSFKCGDVKRLVEITQQLDDITKALAMSIPDDGS